MTFDQAVIESNFDALAGVRAFDALALHTTTERGFIAHAIDAITSLVNERAPVSVKHTPWADGSDE